MTTTVKTPRKKSGDRFLTNLRYENIVSRPFWWRLKQSLCFHSERMNTVVIVPKGREQNLASIPRPLWSIWPPTDPRYAAAASVHDELYRLQIKRRVADLVFKDAIKAIGKLSRIETFLFYAAVAAGGGPAYKRAAKYGDSVNQ